MNWFSDSFPALVLLLGFTTKVTIVLALSWMTAGVLRRRSAAQKHRVWTAGILGSLMLPLCAMFIPTRYSGALGTTAAHWVPETSVVSGGVLSASSSAIMNHVPVDVLYGNLTRLALSIWALGLSLVALKLLVGLIQLVRMSARSRLLLDPGWRRLVTEISKSFEVARPVRILQCCNRVSMPLTWGIFHPRIILPSDAAAWPEDRRRIVLAHELAHIGRQDWLLQMCAELLRCLYWFHPLAWIAAGKLRQESEHACDDAVLNSGIPAPDYAHELLDLAQTLESSGHRWSTALVIARPSNLERRFTAMLIMSINRRRLSRKARLITTSVAACLLLSLAAFRMPAQGQSAKTSTAPQGWLLAGSRPADYETGVDPQASYHGFSSAYLKSKPSVGEGFGTLMQAFSAGQYAGKRARLRAWVKAEKVSDWAGLWMRVDTGPKPAVSFDNMMDRPIKGTTDWHHYDVVLDVPRDATSIAIGILLNKSGTVWINNVEFEGVGADVPTTGRVNAPLPEGPTNLNFKD